MTTVKQAIDPGQLADLQANAQAVIDATKALQDAASARDKAIDVVSATTDKLTQAQQTLAAAATSTFGGPMTFTYANCTFVYLAKDGQYSMAPIPPALETLGAGT